MKPRSRTIEHDYEAALTWTGNEGSGTSDYRSYGRSYTVSIAGKPDLQGSADPTFRGDAALHNPEDLFVAAISGCHMLSYLALCARRGVRVIAYEDRATGVLTLEGGGGRFTGVELNPKVTVAGGADLELAERLHETAHEQCFIASSVSVPIRCNPTIRTASNLSRPGRPLRVAHGKDDVPAERAGPDERPDARADGGTAADHEDPA